MCAHSFNVTYIYIYIQKDKHSVSYFKLQVENNYMKNVEILHLDKNVNVVSLEKNTTRIIIDSLFFLIDSID